MDYLEKYRVKEGTTLESIYSVMSAENTLKCSRACQIWDRAIYVIAGSVGWAGQITTSDLNEVLHGHHDYIHKEIVDWLDSHDFIKPVEAKMYAIGSQFKITSGTYLLARVDEIKGTRQMVCGLICIEDGDRWNNPRVIGSQYTLFTGIPERIIKDMIKEDFTCIKYIAPLEGESQ